VKEGSVCKRRIQNLILKLMTYLQVMLSGKSLGKGFSVRLPGQVEQGIRALLSASPWRGLALRRLVGGEGRQDREQPDPCSHLLS